MNLKSLLRNLLNFLHWDVTKNLAYDRQTRAVMQRVLRPDSRCIDVGCHKGEMLDLMLKYAPEGKHYAFEPIPYLYEKLLERYEGRAEVFPFALAEAQGNSAFQLVKNAPAYSGIKKRKYAVTKPEIEEIRVELRTLDEVIPEAVKIDFMKIDVEGGEFGVLKGARRILETNRPVVVFECGLGASDYYGTDPQELYRFVSETGLHINTLSGFLKQLPPLNSASFENLYETNTEYYFVAY